MPWQNHIFLVKCFSKQKWITLSGCSAAGSALALGACCRFYTHIKKTLKTWVFLSFIFLKILVWPQFWPELWKIQFHKIQHRGVAQLVARLLWEQDAVGSSPATPTKDGYRTFVLYLFFMCGTWRFGSEWQSGGLSEPNPRLRYPKNTAELRLTLVFFDRGSALEYRLHLSPKAPIFAHSFPQKRQVPPLRP